MSKRWKDAGRPRAGSTGPTEDAPARRSGRTRGREVPPVEPYSQLPHFAVAGAVPTGCVPEVDHDLRALDQVVVVDGAVRCDDDDAVVALGRVVDGAHAVELRDVRVVVRHLRAGLVQQLADLLRG